jgi:anti-sigma B factor antagonist
MKPAPLHVSFAKLEAPGQRSPVMFTFHRRDVGDVTVIELSGQLVDGPGGDSLRAEIKQLLASGRRKFLVNMGALSWISSSGIGIVVSALSTIRQAGGRMKLAQLSKQVESIVVITKLGSVLEIHASEAEALAGFREAGKGD